MTRLFIEKQIERDVDMWEIEGESARYLSDVLRMRVGEELILCDVNRIDHECEIVNVAKARDKTYIICQ